MKAEGESDVAALLRWWDAAEDCGSNDLRGRVLRAVTEVLELEGLASGGSLTKAGKALIRRVDAQAQEGRRLVTARDRAAWWTAALVTAATAAGLVWLVARAWGL